MSDVPHYQTKRLECIEVIRAALTPEEFEGFCKGNMIKYTYRAGDKQDKKRDLEKAADYTCMLAHGCWMSDYAEMVSTEYVVADRQSHSKAVYDFGRGKCPTED